MKTLATLILFRCLNSLLIKTYFDPDEYWQAQEVAHEFVFGYGYLTWEWRHGLRGFAYPLLLSFGYYLLKILGLDSSNLVIIMPRLIQAVFAGLCDYFTMKLGTRLFDQRVGKLALFCSLTNFFNLFALTRTFSNSIETTFTAMALYWWPFRFNEYRLRIALLCAGLACTFRPSNCVLWLFLGALQLKTKKRIQVLRIALLNVLLVLFVNVGIDSLYYRKWTFVAWNFFKFNVLHSISEFYGTHPFHWYLTQGIPLICMAQLPLFIKGMNDCYSLNKHRVLIWLVGWTIGCYSLLKHKEFRFLMPLIPLFSVFSGFALSRLDLNKVRLSIIAIVLVNGISFYFFGTLHQRGVVDVLHWLRRRNSIEPIDSVMFLMPCHSTPFHSFMHSKTTKLDFLTCEPPLNGAIDESRVFYENHEKFNFNHSYLVAFESLSFNFEGYSKCAKFFNSVWHDDNRRRGNVLVYCKSNK